MLERATRRMQDVAADGDRQAGDAALGAADGERIEQRLGGMLMGAVAGVDDRAVDLLRQQLDRAGRVMAHDQDVGAHGVERHGRVDQRLALLHGGGRHVHVHDVGAEPLARQLEGALRAGRGLEEQVDQRSPAQDVALLVDLAVAVGGLVGEIEQCVDLACRQVLTGQEMAAGERGLGLWCWSLKPVLYAHCAGPASGACGGCGIAACAHPVLSC